MQAIIMAAGKGSRLGNLTEGLPKSFLKIKEHRLIDYNLRLLQKYGINDIVIVTGYRCEAFEELARGMKNVRLVFNPFYELVNVLGSFYMGMEALYDDFIYIQADTLCDPSIFEKLVQTKADVLLPIDYGPCDAEAMKIRCEGDRLVEITKEMPLDAAEGEFIGIASFRKQILPALKNVVKQLMQEKAFSAYFESAIQRLLDEKAASVQLIPTEGAFWAEIDFLEDYKKASAEIPAGLTELFH